MVTGFGFKGGRSRGKGQYLMTLPTDRDGDIYAGDPVALNASGQVALVTASTSVNFAGVIQAVYGKRTDANSPPRALTFNQPASGPYLVSGQSGFALVNTDPDTTYIAVLDATASSGLVGQTVNVSAGAGNSRAGVSGYSLAAATLGASAEHPFKIVGIAPEQQINGFGDAFTSAGGSTFCLVEVKPNGGRNIFKQAGGI